MADEELSAGAGGDTIASLLVAILADSGKADEVLASFESGFSEWITSIENRGTQLDAVMSGIMNSVGTATDVVRRGAEAASQALGSLESAVESAVKKVGDGAGALNAFAASENAVAESAGLMAERLGLAEGAVASLTTEIHTSHNPLGEFSTWLGNVTDRAVKMRDELISAAGAIETVAKAGLSAVGRPLQSILGGQEHSVAIAGEHIPHRPRGSAGGSVDIFEEPVRPEQTQNRQNANQPKRGIAHTPDNREVKYRWQISELDDLKTSHDVDYNPTPGYDQRLQNRDLSSAANRNKIEGIASHLRFADVSGSGSTATGAPMFGEDNQGEAGNGRTMGIRLASEKYPAKYDQYKKDLTESAPEYGFSPDYVASFRKPVLHRVNETPTSTDDARISLVKSMGLEATGSFSATETAKDDAQLLRRSGALRQFNPDQDLTHSSNQQFVQSFLGMLSNNDHAALLNNGRLGVNGVQRINNALLGSAYDDPHSMSRLMESTDNNVRGIGMSMLQSAPEMALLKQGTQTGEYWPQLDITPHISSAVNTLSHLRDQGTSVSAFLSQQTLGGMGEEMHPVAKDILTTFDKYKNRPNIIREMLSNYAVGASLAGSPHQESMFGDEIAGNEPSVADVWQGAKNGTILDDPKASAADKAKALDTLPVDYEPPTGRTLHVADPEVSPAQSVSEAPAPAQAALSTAGHDQYKDTYSRHLGGVGNLPSPDDFGISQEDAAVLRYEADKARAGEQLAIQQAKAEAGRGGGSPPAGGGGGGGGSRGGGSGRRGGGSGGDGESQEDFNARRQEFMQNWLADNLDKYDKESVKPALKDALIEGGFGSNPEKEAAILRTAQEYMAAGPREQKQLTAEEATRQRSEQSKHEAGFLDYYNTSFPDMKDTRHLGEESAMWSAQGPYASNSQLVSGFRAQVAREQRADKAISPEEAKRLADQETHRKGYHDWYQNYAGPDRDNVRGTPRHYREENAIYNAAGPAPTDLEKQRAYIAEQSRLQRERAQLASDQAKQDSKDAAEARRALAEAKRAKAQQDSKDAAEAKRQSALYRRAGTSAVRADVLQSVGDDFSQKEWGSYSRKDVHRAINEGTYNGLSGLSDADLEKRGRDYWAKNYTPGSEPSHGLLQAGDRRNMDSMNSKLEENSGGGKRDGSFMGGMAGYGLLAASGGILDFTSQLIKQATATDDALHKLYATAGEGGADGMGFDALKAEVLSISRAFGQMPAEAAAALYPIESHGYHGAQALKILAASAAMARGSETDLHVVSDLVVKTLDAYGLGANKAGQMTDIFTKAISLSNVQGKAFVPAFVSLVQMGSQLHLSLQDLSGAFAQMTKDTKSPSVAATYLRATLYGIIHPADQAKDALKKAGLGWLAAGKGAEYLQKLGLQGTLDLIAKATGGNVTALAKLFPDLRKNQGLMSLLSKTMHGLPFTMDQMAHSTGSVAAANKEVTKEGVQTYKDLAASIGVAANAFYDQMRPAVNEVLQEVIHLFDSFSSLPQPVMKFLAYGLEATGVLLGIGGALMLAIRWGNAFAGMLDGPIKEALIGFRAIPMIGWLLAIVGAMILLKNAWDQDWGHIRENSVQTMKMLETLLGDLAKDLNDVARWFNSLSGAAKNWIGIALTVVGVMLSMRVGLLGLVGVLAGGVTKVLEFIGAMSEMVRTMKELGVVYTITNYLTGFKNTAGALATGELPQLKTALLGIRDAWLAIDFAAWANPLGLAIAAVVAAIGAIGYAVVKLSEDWDQATQSEKDYEDRLKGLIDKGGAAAAGARMTANANQMQTNQNEIANDKASLAELNARIKNNKSGGGDGTGVLSVGYGSNLTPELYNANGLDYASNRSNQLSTNDPAVLQQRIDTLTHDYAVMKAAQPALIKAAQAAGHNRTDGREMSGAEITSRDMKQFGHVTPDDEDLIHINNNMGAIPKIKANYGSIIEQSAGNIPPEVIEAIIAQESGGDPTQVSHDNNVGSKEYPHGSSGYGLMQMTYDNAKKPAWFDKKNPNPQAQIEAGIALLQQKIRAHGGNLWEGVKAYNGSGPMADAYVRRIYNTYTKLAGDNAVGPNAFVGVEKDGLYPANAGGDLPPWAQGDGKSKSNKTRAYRPQHVYSEGELVPGFHVTKPDDAKTLALPISPANYKDKKAAIDDIEAQRLAAVKGTGDKADLERIEVESTSTHQRVTTAALMIQKADAAMKDHKKTVDQTFSQYQKLQQATSAWEKHVNALGKSATAADRQKLATDTAATAEAKRSVEEYGKAWAQNNTALNQAKADRESAIQSLGALDKRKQAIFDKEASARDKNEADKYAGGGVTSDDYSSYLHAQLSAPGLDPTSARYNDLITALNNLTEKLDKQAAKDWKDSDHSDAAKQQYSQYLTGQLAHQNLPKNSPDYLSPDSQRFSDLTDQVDAINDLTQGEQELQRQTTSATSAISKSTGDISGEFEDRLAALKQQAAEYKKTMDPAIVNKWAESQGKLLINQHDREQAKQTDDQAGFLHDTHQVSDDDYKKYLQKRLDDATQMWGAMSDEARKYYTEVAKLDEEDYERQLKKAKEQYQAGSMSLEKFESTLLQIRKEAGQDTDVSDAVDAEFDSIQEKANEVGRKVAESVSQPLMEALQKDKTPQKAFMDWGKGLLVGWGESVIKNLMAKVASTVISQSKLLRNVLKVDPSASAKDKAAAAAANAKNSKTEGDKMEAAAAAEKTADTTFATAVNGDSSKSLRGAMDDFLNTVYKNGQKSFRGAVDDFDTYVQNFITAMNSASSSGSGGGTGAGAGSETGGSVGSSVGAVAGGGSGGQINSMATAAEGGDMNANTGSNTFNSIDNGLSTGAGATSGVGASDHTDLSSALSGAENPGSGPQVGNSTTQKETSETESGLMTAGEMAGGPATPVGAGLEAAGMILALGVGIASMFSNNKPDYKDKTGQQSWAPVSGQDFAPTIDTISGADGMRQLLAGHAAAAAASGDAMSSSTTGGASGLVDNSKTLNVHEGAINIMAANDPQETARQVMSSLGDLAEVQDASYGRTSYVR